MRPTSLRLGLIALAISSQPVTAQTPPARPPAGAIPGVAPGRISGVVQGPDGQPLPSAGITVRSATDSSLVTGALTEKNGRFRIEGLAIGRYTIRVSLIGYKPRTSEVVALTAEKLAYDFGPIPLVIAPVELKAVEAVGEKSPVVVEADRTVYSTKDMPAAAGTAIDVLRAVPELELDVNDNVKLRGNQSVVLQLNGRPMPIRDPQQLANFLKQMPGNRIAKIEVMPNPSAKHDPEGMGGIVNIVLKENADLGLSGNLSVGTSTRNQQSMYGRLNFQRGRLTLFSGANFGIYQSEGSSYDFRQNLIARPLTSIEQNSTTDNTGTSGGLDWSLEYKVGKQATLWSNAYMYRSGSENDGLLRYGILNDVNAVRERYDRESAGEYFGGFGDVGLGFTQVFQQLKHELRIDGRMNLGDNESNNRLTKLFLMAGGQEVDLPLELTLSDGDDQSRGLTLQADYYRPFAKGRVDVGYRAYRRTQDSDNLMEIFASPEATSPREQARSGYEYDETFNAFYTTVAQTFGKIGVQGGLRAELAHTHFLSHVSPENFDNNYKTLFPSANVSYTIKPGRTLRLLYSKRIQRPYAFHFVTPVAMDPLNRTVGNPNIRPSYTHAFSSDVSVTGKYGTLRVGPYYNRSVDVWDRIRKVDSAGVATNRTENVATAQQYGSSFTVSLRSTNKLSGSTNFRLYRDQRDGSNITPGLKRGAVLWSLGGNLGYKFKQTLTAQAFGNYTASQYILQGRATGYTYMSLGLRQQLWGTKGSLSLNINDPLALNKYNSNTRDVTYIQTSRSSFKSRMGYLSFTYNFGKPPQQMSRGSTADSGGGDVIRVR